LRYGIITERYLYSAISNEKQKKIKELKNQRMSTIFPIYQNSVLPRIRKNCLDDIEKCISLSKALESEMAKKIING
jgi:hypothetical protein